MTKFINFNDLAAGTVVDNEFSSQGVTISAAGGSNKAMIFNTAHPTGGDHDLETSNLGKALIISEDGDSHDPDDNGSGGTFFFNFDAPSSINRLTFLDIEEGARVKFFDAHGNHIKTVHIDDTDDNGQLIQDFDVDGVARMEVTLHGSGAIDNLVFDNSGLDGIVENDNDGDLIDLAYDGDPDGDCIDAGDAVLPGEAPNDDIVDALGGDDTIKSEQGDDEVYAGSGDDSVLGGTGDDLILGDSNYEGPNAGVTTREVFEWDEAGFDDGDDVGGFTQNTGSVDVTFSVLKETGHADTEFSDDKQNVQNIDDDGSDPNYKSSLQSVTNGQGNDADYRLDFSAPVEDVSFRINDIDGDGVVMVKAFDADGNPITVNLEGGDRLTLLDTDGVAGADTADSNGGYLEDTAEEYSLLVSIPGPVSRIEILHDQDGNGNSGINITDVYFDAPVLDDGVAGNDVLKGGAGDDTIFGEDGDDTLKGEDDNDVLDGGDGDDSLSGGKGDDALTGGDGADIVMGGANADTIFGGAGDTVDGGSGGFNSNPALNTDNDVLDLTGQGPFFLDNVTPDTNGNGINGTVVFLNADGTPNGLTLDFTEIEEVIGDEINRGPDANDDSATTDEDTPVVIDVLGNDTDPDGDALTVTEATSPDGDVTINPDGTLTFTPDENFNGDTTITYTVSDGNGGTDTATVDVSVTPVNDAPDAVNDTDTTDEETPVLVDVLANDTDPDGDDLTITGASVPSEQGTVEIVDNKLLFTPAENFTGDATISYSITDGNGGTDVAEAVVTVNNVNDGPVAVDDFADTDEDTPVTIDVLANDTDVDGDDLTIVSATVPADQGTVEIVGNELLFTPAPDFNGPATITYTVSDGNGGTDEGVANVNVGAVNDGPVAVDDTEETDEDTPVTIDVLANDTDPDGDDLEITGASVPSAQGTVEIVDNKLVYTPAENFNGDVTITYSITDGNGGTDTAEVAVTVNPVNDDPVAVDDIETTDEDVAVVVDLLGNDSDVDGDDLSIAAVSVPPEQGTVVDNGDGTVTFTPAPDFNGPATITYTVSDGNGGTDEGEAVISVGAVNDAPVAEDDAATTDEDTPVTIDVLANDSDPDGDDLTIISATVPADQGTVEIVDNKLVFTPAPDFNGEATVTYTISDGMGLTDTADAVVTVEGVEDAPEAADDLAETDEDTPVTIPVLDNDSDPDGDPLEVTEATSPDGDVTINPDGTITFTPDENFNGDTTIEYTVTDPDGNTDTATVAVTVNPVNDAPDAVDDSDTTDEEVAITVDLLANDTDPDGDDLTVVSATLIAGEGEIVDNGDGTVTFTPDDNFNGEAVIEYTIEDEGGLQDTALHTITVNAVEDAPEATDDVAETDEDTPVTIPVLDNDSDPDGDPLEVTEATSPDGEVTINPDGTITFTPDENFNGPTTIEYTVSDPDGNTDTATVNVTVNPVNDEPVAEDDNATTPFNTAVTVPVLANDTDVDGDPLEVTEATSPDGTVDINPDGTITFTPNDGFEGDAVVDYTISDGNGGTDTAQVFITVEEQPLDGIVEGTDDGELIDEDYVGDPEGDMVDNEDNIFSNDPDKANDDIIEAGGGDDTILSGEGSDTIDGGTGNDLIDSSTGEFAPDKGFPNDDGTPIPGFPFGFPADDDPEDDRDFVDGGEGDDTISTGDDADTIVGGIGADVIDGGIDDDEITGDEGADRIVGGEGSDLIEGGIGNDTIYAGNDPDLGLDQLNIEDDGSNPIFPADPRPDNGKDTVFGGDGDDVIFGADDDDELFGEEGDDFIDGEIDDDLIDGGVGEDTLLGGQGNDTILGGNDADFIDAGRNADTVDGGEGADTILGGNGADELSGGDGDDLIDGGTGDDTLSGDEGDDTIIGSTGDDVIDGGSGNDLIDGGNGGADIMSGGDDRDTFINVDAGEVVDGNEGGDDFDTLDLTGSAPPNGSLQVVFDPGNPENGVVNYFDQNGDPAGVLTFSNIENVIPCFTPGTRIATPTGERRVEDLQVGDRVITRDNGIQEIRWVGRRDMTGVELDAAEHLRPVLIREGALGKGLPERDMLVSPQHRVLMSGDKTMLYFDESEVLVAAKHLTHMDGIDVVDVSETTYIHVMFDQHEVILSDGSWTESFQPGDMTLGAMGEEQRSEILELFPELATAEGIEGYEAARRSLKKHEAMLLTL
ncbi:MAG: tandem-95 repeat protein [Pseudomonadota bacterium]